MDQDGANMRYLTRGDELVVTPRFSPSIAGNHLHGVRRAATRRVYLLNIETGQREVVGNFPGMTFSPRFSPDGQKIIMSLSQGARRPISTSMDLRSRTTTRLTDTSAIDTSPSYSPDGSQIVFECDRGGSQQIYVMGAIGGGGQAHLLRRRPLFDAGVVAARATTSPSPSRTAATFAIGMMKPDGSGERILTEGFHNEGPTWAPNGLFLMFFRDPGGAGGPKIYMVDIFGRSE